MIGWIKKKLKARARKKGAEDLRKYREKFDAMTEEEFQKLVEKSMVKKP